MSNDNVPCQEPDGQLVELFPGGPTIINDRRIWTPADQPVYVSIGFKKANVKWGWVNLRDPGVERSITGYVRHKRWLVEREADKWAGLGVSLLGYEHGSSDARKLMWRFYFDLDAEGDLEHARAEAVKAARGLDALGVATRKRFSGSKGFGLEVQGNGFNSLGWQQNAHLAGKYLTADLIDLLDLDPLVVDDTLWAKRKLIVRENIRHPKTGRLSIPLTTDELENMPIADILTLAEQGPRRDVPRETARWSNRLNAMLVRAQAKADAEVGASEAKVFTPRKTCRSARPLLPVEPDRGLDLSDLLDGVTPCVRSLITGPVRDVVGRRNELVVALVRWAKTNDITQARAVDLVRRITEARLRVRTPWSDAVSEVEATADWAYSTASEGLNAITCHKLRSFGLDCTDQCPFFAEAEANGTPARQQPVRRDNYVLPEPPSYDTVSSGRDRVRAAVRALVAEGGVQLLRIPAGVGKTRTGLEEALRWANRADRTPGDPWRILYIAERHDLIVQANVWFSGAFHHIKPRSPHNCIDASHAADIAAKGFAATETVCRGCEHFKHRTCGYWTQWKVRDGHWAMTLDMAADLQLDTMGFGLIVMDESLVPHIADRVEITENLLAESSEKVHVVEEWPNGFGELDFLRDVDVTWFALMSALTTLSKQSGEVDLQGAAVARKIAEQMKKEGIAEPLSAMRKLVQVGLEYDAVADGTYTSPSDLPPRAWVKQTAQAVLDGLEQLDADASRAGAVPLRFDTQEGEWGLTVGFRRHYPTGDVPTALLDATGDSILAARILGREVDMTSVRVPVAHGQAVQIADAKYARATLLTPSGKLNPVTWRRLRPFLVARCAEARDRNNARGRTLIITSKAVAAKLMAKPFLAELGGEDFVTVTWFWGNRGADYADHDQVIAIGYPFPNENAVVDLASVIYQGEDLDTSTTTAWRPYLHDDGRTGLEVRVFADERLQRVCEQLREAELYQSIMRIRPLGNPWKRVVLLTQIPTLPEYDIHLSGLLATSELFATEAARTTTRSRVKTWVDRLLRKEGWVGLPWLADLCGLTPTGSIKDLHRATGGKSPTPTDALLLGWGQAIVKMKEVGHGIPFRREGGKRDDRLRDFFEDALPDGLDACHVSLQALPAKPGRPWSATIYSQGVEGRSSFLRRLHAVVSDGAWKVRVEGRVVSADDLDRYLHGLEVVSDDDAQIEGVIGLVEDIERARRMAPWRYERSQS